MGITMESFVGHPCGLSTPSAICGIEHIVPSKDMTSLAMMLSRNTLYPVPRNAAIVVLYYFIII